MKTLIIISLSLFFNQFSFGEETNKSIDADFLCEITSDNKRYEDLFLIKFRTEDHSQIWYQRKHLLTPEGLYGELEIVRGCYLGKQTETSEGEVRIECIDMGEEGKVDINLKTLNGEMYFYMPKIGYPERTLFDISCKKL